MPVLLAGLDYITGEHPAFPLITMGLPSKSKILAGGLDVEEHVQKTAFCPIVFLFHLCYNLNRRDLYSGA